VLQPDIRILTDIANLVIEMGYAWCVANRDPCETTRWWEEVQRIEEGFSWKQLLVGDPITAKVHGGSFEFGSIDQFGGGCHRSIALAVAVISNRISYRPFDILLYCP
jgi:hypothetical protein